MNLATWLWSLVAITVAVGLVTGAHWVLNHKLRSVWSLATPLVERCKYSAYAAAVVVAVNIVVPGASVFSERAWYTVYEHGIRIGMIITLTWLGVSVAYALSDGILERLSVYDEDTDRKARRLRTQIRLARRVITSLIVFIALASILWTFPEIRALSAGLLGTAGVLSIVAGVAAQSTLGNIFAGIQLVGDQLRINDIVVVENEWGRVEELTLTTVVVRIWDERRLVLPVSYFTNNAFENWTKHGATVTGKVYLRVDWQVPVRELREQTGDYIGRHPLWDGRRWSLQATDVLESGSVELRVVVTAADSDAQWDLCCDVREFLITYITEQYPEALPHRRTQLLDGTGREPGELRTLIRDE
ncbi:mechanosensitive ion channel [Spiractinospora alimapuensis]|uniref:mechanosensitive ion channel family protein n=1 Tax=Spiractinospora alimapuensis TaxID=2820884 RepID=UPI001F2E38A2|nr:mechanosensitive ion channel domain-containing protein [Spiractinospora alimapuensis]QVQ52121.1 mechanosensitive ion channel [Spiractinospora alimapuensis]